MLPTKDAHINHICDFLDSCIHPLDLLDSKFTSFVNTTTCFFLFNSALYHYESHSHQQLVVPLGHRYGLIQKAHNDPGHKGVFSVRTCLLLHFWWPMLVDDVK